jgi:hypothetical protein
MLNNSFGQHNNLVVDIINGFRFLVHPRVFGIVCNIRFHVPQYPLFWNLWRYPNHISIWKVLIVHCVNLGAPPCFICFLNVKPLHISLTSTIFRMMGLSYGCFCLIKHLLSCALLCQTLILFWLVVVVFLVDLLGKLILFNLAIFANMHANFWCNLMVHCSNKKGLVLGCPFRRPLPVNYCLPFLCPVRLRMLKEPKPWAQPLLL